MVDVAVAMIRLRYFLVSQIHLMEVNVILSLLPEYGMEAQI